MLLCRMNVTSKLSPFDYSYTMKLTDKTTSMQSSLQSDQHLRGPHVALQQQLSMSAARARPLQQTR